MNSPSYVGTTHKQTATEAKNSNTIRINLTLYLTYED